jgi:hypothetical protein
MHTLFLSDLMNLEFLWQAFKESSYITFQEIPSSGSRPVPSGRTDRQTDRDMTKLIVAFAVLRTRLKSFNPLGSIASAINNAPGRKVDISTIREGADRSLARPISPCRRTESIVSLERGVCSYVELQVFSLQRLKGSMSGDACDFNNIETRVIIRATWKI